MLTGEKQPPQIAQLQRLLASTHEVVSQLRPGNLHLVYDEKSIEKGAQNKPMER